MQVSFTAARAHEKLKGVTANNNNDEKTEHRRLRSFAIQLNIWMLNRLALATCVFAIATSLTSTAFGLHFSQIPLPVSSVPVWDIEHNPVNGDVYVQVGDPTYRSTNGGDSWNQVLFLSSTNSMAISQTGTLLVGSFGNGIRRSTNNGSSWSTVNTGLPTTQIWNIVVRADGVFFACTQSGLSKSTNDGVSWVSAGISSTSIDEVAFAGASTIYAGSHWGTTGIFVSTNDGANWANITSGLAGSHRWGLGVAANGDIYTGSDTEGAFKSTDLGQSWTSIGHPAFRYRAISFMGDGTVLSGSEGAGLYEHIGGTSWVSQNSGLTNTSVLCVKSMPDGKVWVGTASSGGNGGLFESCDPSQDSTCIPSSYNLAVFYVVPSNVTYSPAVHRRLIEATVNIQNWYRCATGGLTWTFAFPETVQVYNGLQTREFYLNNGDWWGSLPAEMSTAGKPIWSPGTVTALLAQGAGWWAGAAQGCGTDCGLAILGVEGFPEFNNPAYSGSNCPGGTGGAAWPCTPEGAFAHELGHTLGLPHPDGVPETATDASHSIMQTHWNYPNYAPPSETPWGFLTREVDILDGNPFMKAVNQSDVPDPVCDIVNLPNSGQIPTCDFTYVTDGALTATFTNQSLGAVRSWWYFGDGSDSHAESVVHTFPAFGSYSVRLQVVGASGMSATVVKQVVFTCCDLAGDADNNGIVNISDAVYLITYIFANGTTPSCQFEGDPDCSGIVTISDVVYLINYIFAGGPAPCGLCN